MGGSSGRDPLRTGIDHAKRLSRWADAWKKVEGKSKSASSRLNWFVYDNVDTNIVTVRFVYHSGKHKADYLMDLRRSLTDGVDLSLSAGVRTSLGVDNVADGRLTHGQDYGVPVSDLPAKLQFDREELIHRYHVKEEAEFELRKGLEILNGIDNLDAKYTRREGVLGEFRAGIDALNEAKCNASRIKVGKLRRDTKVYETAVRKWLGIPASEFGQYYRQWEKATSGK